MRAFLLLALLLAASPVPAAPFYVLAGGHHVNDAPLAAAFQTQTGATAIIFSDSGTLAQDWTQRTFLTPLISAIRQRQAQGDSLLGLAWVHGEEDSHTAAASSYAANLAALVHSLRLQVGEFPLAYSRLHASWSTPFADAVRAQQSSFTGGRMVTIDDLRGGLVYPAATSAELGRRLAMALTSPIPEPTGLAMCLPVVALLRRRK